MRLGGTCEALLVPFSLLISEGFPFVLLLYTSVCLLRYFQVREAMVPWETRRLSTVSKNVVQSSQCLYDVTFWTVLAPFHLLLGMLLGGNQEWMIWRFRMSQAGEYVSTCRVKESPRRCSTAVSVYLLYWQVKVLHHLCIHTGDHLFYNWNCSLSGQLLFSMKSDLWLDQTSVASRVMWRIARLVYNFCRNDCQCWSTANHHKRIINYLLL